MHSITRISLVHRIDAQRKAQHNDSWYWKEDDNITDASRNRNLKQFRDGINVHQQDHEDRSGLPWGTSDVFRTQPNADHVFSKWLYPEPFISKRDPPSPPRTHVILKPLWVVAFVSAGPPVSARQSKYPLNNLSCQVHQKSKKSDLPWKVKQHLALMS